MARQTLLLFVATLVASATAAAAAVELVVQGRTADVAGWMRPGPISCQGTVEECLHEREREHDDVFGLRRRLVYAEEEEDGGGYPTQYISYSALMRDSVPCSVPGASYYNCHPGAVANPYSRGCSAISQCRD
ncbi:hypothetical protein CFC21_061692 [Triticum aestivum]|nr:protein RALF-like 33 [Aegilops tauschii subsp. strangulata]XP_044377872.1 protein RALF-like 33 [Triticum aestivum]KAF7053883.1 hypothetical protein CFC21_061692 [Triticum aestivum]